MHGVEYFFEYIFYSVIHLVIKIGQLTYIIKGNRCSNIYDDVTDLEGYGFTKNGNI